MRKQGENIKRTHGMTQNVTKLKTVYFVELSARVLF